MLLNELAQWAVLIGLCVLTIGLLRQLGAFMVGPTARYGPPLNRPLPGRLLPRDIRERLAQLISEHQPLHAGSIIVLSEACPSCTTLRDTLAAHASSNSFPALAIASGPATAGFIHSLHQEFDLVLADPAGRFAAKAEIPGTPFLVSLDEGLIVRHNVYGDRLAPHILEWTQPPSRRENSGPLQGDELQARDHRADLVLASNTGGQPT